MVERLFRRIHHPAFFLFPLAPRTGQQTDQAHGYNRGRLGNDGVAEATVGADVAALPMPLFTEEPNPRRSRGEFRKLYGAQRLPSRVAGFLVVEGIDAVVSRDPFSKAQARTFYIRSSNATGEP